MPKKKRPSGKRAIVKVGNISNISGKVNIAGDNIEIHEITKTGLSIEDITRVFDQLYTAIKTNTKTSSTDKENLKAEVKEIQSAVTEAVKKNEKVQESFLSRRFRNVARVAPDILDVVVATLASPLAGLGVAVKKIAEKAKEEIGK